LQELGAFQDEPSIFAELRRRRNGLWGALLKQLAQVQDGLLDTPIPKLPVRELYTTLGEIADANSLVLPKTAEWFGRKLTALKGVIEADLHVVFIDGYGHEGKRWIALQEKEAQ